MKKMIMDDVLSIRGLRDASDDEIPEQINPFIELYSDNTNNYIVETLTDICINFIRGTSHIRYNPIYIQAIVRVPGDIAEKIVGGESLFIGEVDDEIKVEFNVVEKIFVIMQGDKKIVDMSVFNIIPALVLDKIRPDLFPAYSILLNWLRNNYKYFYYDSGSLDIIEEKYRSINNYNNTNISIPVLGENQDTYIFAWMTEEKKFRTKKYLHRKRNKKIRWEKYIQNRMWSPSRKDPWRYPMLNWQRRIDKIRYFDQIIDEELELLV